MAAQVYMMTALDMSYQQETRVSVGAYHVGNVGNLVCEDDGAGWVACPSSSSGEDDGAGRMDRSSSRLGENDGAAEED